MSAHHPLATIAAVAIATRAQRENAHGQLNQVFVAAGS